MSRRHAALDSDGTRFVLRDTGSTNGTWVNGERVHSHRELSDGDVVRLGRLELRFQERRPPAGTPARAVATAPRRRAGGKVRLGRTLVIAAAFEVVLLLANVVVTFLTDWTGFGPWLTAPLVGMLVALIDPVKQSLGGSGAGAADGSARAGGPPQARRGTPLAVALVVGVVVLGGGGWAVAAGVSYVTGVVTGNEDGVERLVQPVSSEASGLSITVDSVQHTPNFTRVAIVARNGLTSTVQLPLFNNASLASADGTTLEADSFRSDWSPSLPPAGSVPESSCSPALSRRTGHRVAALFDRLRPGLRRPVEHHGAGHPARPACRTAGRVARLRCRMQARPRSRACTGPGNTALRHGRACTGHGGALASVPDFTVCRHRRPGFVSPQSFQRGRGHETRATRRAPW